MKDRIVKRPGPVPGFDSMMEGKSAQKLLRTMHRQLKEYEAYSNYLEAQVDEEKTFQRIVDTDGGSMRLEEFRSDRSVLKLDWIYIEPEARRKRAGSGLISFAEDIARKKGFKKIIAVPSGNPDGGCLPIPALRSFYASCGFQIIADGFGAEYYEMILE